MAELALDTDTDEAESTEACLARSPCAWGLAMATGMATACGLTGDTGRCLLCGIACAKPPSVAHSLVATPPVALDAADAADADMAEGDVLSCIIPSRSR